MFEDDETPPFGVSRKRLARLRRISSAGTSAAELLAHEIVVLQDLLVAEGKEDIVTAQIAELISRKFARLLKRVIDDLEIALAESEAQRLDQSILSKDIARAYLNLRHAVFDVDTLDQLDVLRGRVLAGDFE
jgi:hypothetical protein